MWAKVLGYIHNTVDWGELEEVDIKNVDAFKHFGSKVQQKKKKSIYEQVGTSVETCQV